MKRALENGCTKDQLQYFVNYAKIRPVSPSSNLAKCAPYEMAVKDASAPQRKNLWHKF
jgi:hypothetical protein